MGLRTIPPPAGRNCSGSDLPLLNLDANAHANSKFETRRLSANAVAASDSHVCRLVLVVNTTLEAQQPDRRDATEADVIVYGSTPGGFCAAIAAAREGASVILLEPTDHVGAMNTGGLSHCDSNQMVRSTVMGLFDEWHTRVVKDYTDRGLDRAV